MKISRKYLRIILPFFIIISIATVAAMYNPPNFSHAIGIAKVSGGEAKHPVMFGLEEDKYTILVTGTVFAPFKGDMKIELKGRPEMDYEIYSYFPPKFQFGIHDWYGFENNTLTDISAWDGFMIIVTLKPKEKILNGQVYYLKFYDAKSNQKLLIIPIEFTNSTSEAEDLSSCC